MSLIISYGYKDTRSQTRIKSVLKQRKRKKKKKRRRKKKEKKKTNKKQQQQKKQSLVKFFKARLRKNYGKPKPCF